MLLSWQGSAPQLQEDFINSGSIQSSMSAQYSGMLDSDLKVIGIYDVELLPNTGAYTDVSITITPDIYGIVPTTKVGLFQYNGTAWDYIAKTVGTGTIYTTFATFNNPSPMVLVVYESTLATPPTPSIKVTQINGTDKDGVPIIGTMTTGTAEALSHYFGGTIPNPDGFPSSIIGSGVSNDDLVLLKFFDLDVSSELSGGVPLTFTFSCPSVTPTSKIYVLNYGEVWAMVDAVAGDGVITASFMHLSPVYIYADASTLAQDEPEPTDSEPAPVMGDGPISMALIIMLVSLIGMAVIIKKE